MMYLVTITNNTSGDTSAFITHDKVEAEETTQYMNKSRGKRYTAQAPIEITEIEIR